MTIEKMILRNKTWIESQKKIDPDFFTKISKGQSPSIFWIGCCDSRVIPNEILNLPLGSVFVQTNIANQIDINDTNTMSSLEYALDVLNIEHIIVCGHTHCAGIETALSVSDTQTLSTTIDKWLAPLKRLSQDLPQDDHSSQKDLLTKLNIKHQVETLSQIPIIQNLWKKGKGPHIHGWLFRIESGEIKEISTQSPLANKQSS